MKKRSNRGFRLVSTYLPYGEEGLRISMRMDYNMSDGIRLFTSKEPNIWEVHSIPYPGKLPAKELAKFVAVFKRSVLQLSPDAKFKKTTTK